jgi:hypothetical protein
MCVRSRKMRVWQRLAGVVPLPSFVAIEFLKPGIWRHVCLVVEIVLLMVVIAMMNRERHSTRSAADLPEGRVRGELPPGRRR